MFLCGSKHDVWSRQGYERLSMDLDKGPANPKGSRTPSRKRRIWFTCAFTGEESQSRVVEYTFWENMKDYPGTRHEDLLAPQ